MNVVPSQRGTGAVFRNCRCMVGREKCASMAREIVRSDVPELIHISEELLSVLTLLRERERERERESARIAK